MHQHRIDRRIETNAILSHLIEHNDSHIYELGNVRKKYIVDGMLEVSKEIENAIKLFSSGNNCLRVALKYALDEEEGEM